MSWTIETIGRFFESKMNNPAEYNRLLAEDPTCLMWAGMRRAEADYAAALKEHQSLGAGAISADPTKTAELEQAMTDALAARDACRIGLEAACGALGVHQEPTVRALQSRADYLRRIRQPSEAGTIEALIANLEGIAKSAGV